MSPRCFLSPPGTARKGSAQHWYQANAKVVHLFKAWPATRRDLTFAAVISELWHTACGDLTSPLENNENTFRLWVWGWRKKQRRYHTSSLLRTSLNSRLILWTAMLAMAASARMPLLKEHPAPPWTLRGSESRVWKLSFHFYPSLPARKGCLLSSWAGSQPQLGAAPSRINTKRPFTWSTSWNFHSKHPTHDTTGRLSISVRWIHVTAGRVCHECFYFTIDLTLKSLCYFNRGVQYRFHVLFCNRDDRTRVLYDWPVTFQILVWLYL